MNHIELWKQETREPTHESEWMLFCERAEKMLGHSLDGDEDTDGYSIDGAYDSYCGGMTAQEYATEIRHPGVDCAKFYDTGE